MTNSEMTPDNAPLISRNRSAINGREPHISPTYQPRFQGAIAKRALAIKYVQTRHIEGLIEQLDETNRRGFACECAENSYSFYEKAFPQDSRVSEAILLARSFDSGGVERYVLQQAHQIAKEAAKEARKSGEAAAYAAALCAAWSAACFLRSDEQAYDLWSACLAPRYNAWAHAVAANEVGSVLTSELPDILDNLWRNNNPNVAAWGASRSRQLRRLAEYHRL